MKAIDLIGRALRLLSVADANESPDAPMYQDALSVLNVMLAEWTQADIGQTDAAFATLQSTVAEQADSDAIAYQLALRLAPEYGIDVAPRILDAAEVAMNRLRLRYFEQGEISFLELPSTVQPFDIVTGE